MESIVQEIANVGFTLLVFVVAIVAVRWLDKNIFSNHKKFNKEKDND
mgnify:CR=1 FL=1